MSMRTPFTISIKELASQSPERAVEIFRRILWAEAGSVGIGKHLIDVPDCINVGDGGIDAIIENANPSNNEIIPKGTTGFQIKSSDLEPKDCKKELHIDENLQNDLKPEVMRILNEGGNYILVLFADITSQKLRNRENALKSELTRLGYKNKVRIYTANKTVGFMEKHLSLVGWFSGKDTGYLHYDAWGSRGDVNTPSTFISDDERNTYIKTIREAIRNPENNSSVFRIIGLSGIGKTRLIFEALKDYDLKNRIVYAPSALEFRGSRIFDILQNNEELSAILVIDDCSNFQHEELIRAFSQRGNNIFLITISYEFAKFSPPTLTLQVNPLGNDSIEKLLESENTNLPVIIKRRLAEFADGYPRIAVLLAESYLSNSNSTDEFIRIDDDTLMNRLIAGRTDTTTTFFQINKNTLTSLSVFNKVGYDGELEKESKWLSELFEIKWTDFREVVHEQRKRGIVQGQFFISVTPFMLRIYLLNNWWKINGFTTKSFNEFIESMPDDLRIDLVQRFSDNIPYISNTGHGRKFVQELLSENGLYADSSFLDTQIGGNFFLRLTEADPYNSILCLKRIIGDWDKEKLHNFRTGRRDVVWALEKIAMFRDLFPEAARILLSLGEAENETYSNNASGVFASLFSLGYGHFANTGATPAERLPILQEAIESESRERRMLALKAINAGLEAGNFIKSFGSENLGLRRVPDLWMPKTWNEIYEGYENIWNLLSDKVDLLEGDEKEEAIRILLHKARGLLKIPKVSTAVIKTIGSLINDNMIDKKVALKELINILHYESKNLPTEILEHITAMKDELTGHDFSSRLHRYVGMNLLEDKIDENRKRSDHVELIIGELAIEVTEKTELIESELEWLVTTEAENGYLFGYNLGIRDSEFLLLPQLIDAQAKCTSKCSVFFLSGYFKAIFEKDINSWENNLDTLLKSEKLTPMIPEITWRSGMTERASVRIIELAENGKIHYNQFGMFRYGGVVKEIPENIIDKWIRFLTAKNDTSALSIALDLCFSFYVYQEKRGNLPEKLTLELLLHPYLFEKCDEKNLDQLSDHNWCNIGLKFFEKCPKHGIAIAERMLANFGTDNTIMGRFFSETHELLNTITENQPEKVWKIIIKYLGPPIDKRAFDIKSWLRGGDHYKAPQGALTFFPEKILWDWIKDDVKTRAWYVAYFVPDCFFAPDKGKGIARELLVQYGHIEEVRTELIANFSSESWSGSEVTHYSNKKETLLEIRRNDTNPNVRKWIDEYISYLDERIEKSMIEEERRGF